MKKLKGRKNSYIIIGLLSVLAISHFFKLSYGAENFLIGQLRPISSRLYASSAFLRGLYDRQMEKRDLGGLLKEMEKMNGQLLAENAKLKSLEEENRTLRDYLNFYQKNKAAALLGNVISRDGFNSLSEAKQSFVIDKGSRDGVEPGLAVLNSEGLVIGKVVSVKDYISEVYLSTSPNCKFAVAVQNGSRTSGVAEGDLGLTIRMKYIPQTESLRPGDVIVTSGLEKNIPRGLVIGRISQVNKESNELWQDAIIEPSANPARLLIVSVFLGG